MGRKGRRSNGTEKKGFSFGLSRAFMRVKELKCSVQHLISRSSFEFARLLLLLRRRRSRRPWPRPLSQPGGRRGPSSQFSQVSKRGEIMFRETFFVGYFFLSPFFGGIAVFASCPQRNYRLAKHLLCHFLPRQNFVSEKKGGYLYISLKRVWPIPPSPQCEFDFFF